MADAKDINKSQNGSTKENATAEKKKSTKRWKRKTRGVNKAPKKNAKNNGIAKDAKKKPSKGKKPKKNETLCQQNRDLLKLDPEKADQIAKNWSEFNLSTGLLNGVKLMGFPSPFEIQKECLVPAIRDFKDVFAASQTGSGKTLAYGLPLLQNILTTKRAEETQKRLKSVIFTPTRELALQVTKHLKAIATFTDLSIVTITGGFFDEKQKRVLAKRPEVVVATPGRFWDLMDNQEIEHLIDLSELKSVVLDEADRLISQGHFKEMANILRSFKEKLEENKKKPQIFVFSATLKLENERFEQIERGNFFKRLMTLLPIAKKPFVVDLTNEHKTSSDLNETVHHCKTDEKDIFTYFFCNRYNGKSLVFVNSVFSLKRLISVLSLLGVNVFGLHSKMQQRQRLKSLDRFRSCSGNAVMVCTDIVSRGLDIPAIENVIHYHMPRETEGYIHRCGRTARALKKGFSVCLVDSSEKDKLAQICDGTNRKNGLRRFTVEKAQLKKVEQAVRLSVQLETAHFAPLRSHMRKVKAKNESGKGREGDGGDVKIGKSEKEVSIYKKRIAALVGENRRDEQSQKGSQSGKSQNVKGTLNISKKRTVRLKKTPKTIQKNRKITLDVSEFGALKRDKNGFLEIRGKNEVKAVEEQK